MHPGLFDMAEITLKTYAPHSINSPDVHLYGCPEIVENDVSDNEDAVFASFMALRSDIIESIVDANFSPTPGNTCKSLPD